MSERKRQLADGRTVAVHRNRGIRKTCGCARRKWPACPHDWHFNFSHRPEGAAKAMPYRFSLDRHIGKRIETREDAEAHADRIRTEIRAGTFTLKPASPPAPAAAATPDTRTFTEYGGLFHKNCPKLRGKNKGKPRDEHDASMLRTLAAAPGADGQPIGPRPISSLTQADFEAALTGLRARNRSASHLNKLRVLVGLLGRWGARKGYLAQTWIKDLEEDSTLKRERGNKRDRRIEPEEEQAVKKHATVLLQRLIIGVLETCCREGELLNLPWGDVRRPRKEFTVRDTKTGAARTLPISPNFDALLELLRLDPAGQERPSDAHVFGDAIGGKAAFPRKAWETAVLKAHGVKPEWTENNALTPACREALKRIDLHFHDLRHEAGSRLLERGWPLHHIQHMLGHASLAQTADYLNVTRMGLHDSMQRFGTVAPAPAAKKGRSRSKGGKAAGTTALHAVAPKKDGDTPPPRNDDATSRPEVTIN